MNMATMNLRPSMVCWPLPSWVWNAFDLKALRTDEVVLSGRVDLDAVSMVRIVDVVGDGRIKDVRKPYF